jgi:hypothetical protein
MKENKNTTYRKRMLNNRNPDSSISVRFIYSIFLFHFIDLFQSSKILSEKLPIRFANIRV